METPKQDWDDNARDVVRPVKECFSGGLWFLIQSRPVARRGMKVDLLGKKLKQLA